MTFPKPKQIITIAVISLIANIVLNKVANKNLTVKNAIS